MFCVPAAVTAVLTYTILKRCPSSTARCHSAISGPLNQNELLRFLRNRAGLEQVRQIVCIRGIA
jgi:hypothetical protein